MGLRSMLGAFSVGCALLLALAGCGTLGKAHSSSGAGGTRAPGGGPPPGGWPKPENGRLTPKMCGLLTDADYAKYGHMRLAADSLGRSKTSSNGIACLYMTNDELDLDLQPTAESAKLTYAAALRDHKQRLSSESHPSMLATGVVPGSDESWFDYWTLDSAGSKFKQYEVRARRGSLLVGVVLSGIKGKNEADPRTLLSGLASLVLQRTPGLGATDTGRTHEVTYKVTGAGRAKTLSYTDPVTRKGVNLKNVRLPWAVDKPLASSGTQQVPLLLNAFTGVPMSQIGCSVSVDGKALASQPPRVGGFASCLGYYTETR